MIKLAPSILSADFARLGEAVLAAAAAGADRIHIDVMDGHFVPNITVGPMVVKALRKVTPITLETHLMIAAPERYIETFAAAGSDLIIVHPESTPHIHRALQMIRKLNKAVGVTLNPGTPLNALDEILDLVDLVLLMTVNPGFGNQVFIPGMYSKIERLAHLKIQRGLNFEIEVDGGVNLETVTRIVRAGATVLVAGAAIFEAPAGIRSAMANLRQAAENANLVTV
ncbi:ribulose-phosphate 3-epimerase [candidate division KSB1 bacterium]|nr:ribulose-phosphate 3-epimerase [candidate division KSB1 bacterium]